LNLFKRRRVNKYNKILNKRNKLIKNEVEQSNIRYNILTAIIYLFGVILIMQLFNLQVVNGSSYREISNTRLSREGKIEAARGRITDRTGVILSSTIDSFSLEMYKTNVDDEILNSSISLMTQILESNGDSYIDDFPVSINPFQFRSSSEEEISALKSKFKIPETASAEESFYLVRDKYGIKSDDIGEIARILAIRYAITTKGYSNTKSIQISSSISRNSAVQIQERSSELSGVNVIEEPIRRYNVNNSASHIIGYVSRINEANIKEFKEKGDTHKYETNDKVGQTGIEKVFEEYLRGEDGVKQIDMNVDGSITGEYTAQEAIGGASIALTIDENLQRVTEQSLAFNVEKIRAGGFGHAYDANGACAVVTNVKTGEILAMASCPDYNPQFFCDGISTEQWNNYNNNKTTPLRNRAVQNSYAPGSIYKMVTAIAGLQEQKIGIYDRINDTGRYYVEGADKDYRCWLYNDYGYGHGPLNVSGAIEKSCNFYFYTVGSRTGIEAIDRYARYFGLGRKTGIELPNETPGLLAAPELVSQREGRNWSEADTIIAAIGQSYNDFSPIQVSKYISMLANGGKNIDLSIIKSVTLSNGTQVSDSEIEEFLDRKLGRTKETVEEIPINQEYLQAVLKGMESVTDSEGGTAYQIFRDFNISVGGKTGSAEAGPNVNAWFVGFAPFENPEVAVVVMVENGGHGFYTAEVVRDVIQEYFGMNVENLVEDMSTSLEVQSIR
jgi:penicillin-binding protein 2